MFKLNTKCDAELLPYSLRHFEAMTTQYTCSLNDVYHPHWIVRWSHHCSHVCIPVHSPWLPGCIDVVQTVLTILTTSWLFPDSKVKSITIFMTPYHLLQDRAISRTETSKTIFCFIFFPATHLVPSTCLGQLPQGLSPGTKPWSRPHTFIIIQKNIFEEKTFLIQLKTFSKNT